MKDEDLRCFVTWIDTTGYLDLIKNPERYAQSDLSNNFTEGCRVTIHRFEGMSPPARSPYLIVYVSGSDTSRPFLKWGTHKSTFLEDTLNPVFNVTLTIPTSEIPPHPESLHLVVQLWHHHTLLPDELIGEVVIPLTRPMGVVREKFDVLSPPQSLLSSLTPMSHQPSHGPVCARVTLDVEMQALNDQPKYM